MSLSEPVEGLYRIMQRLQNALTKQYERRILHSDEVSNFLPEEVSMAKTRVGLSAADISNKWGNKLKGAVGDIQRGIDNVTENPAEKAIEAIPRMVAGVQQAAADGRIEAGLRQVNLNDWKTKTKEKVAQRLAGGVDAAMPKRRQFDQYLVQTLDSVLPSVAAMPKMTIEDGLNRVRTVVMHMHDNPYKQNR